MREPRPERPPGELVDRLKERVYAAFTGLAIVLVLRQNVEHLEAGQAATALAVGIVAITAAGFVADVVAHLVVHEGFPSRVDLRHMLGVSGSALGSAALPLLFLALAWAGLLPLEPALRAASFVYLLVLGGVGYLAVRRTRVAWWKQVVALGLLVALGAGVIALQQIAHGH